jgi:carbamoyltransferase
VRVQSDGAGAIRATSLRTNITNGKFDRLFGGPARKPEEVLAQRPKDLAASVQVVLEEAVTRMTRSLAAETGMKNPCLAGGVAVTNGKVLREGHF